jgi:hypothetical protein
MICVLTFWTSDVIWNSISQVQAHPSLSKEMDTTVDSSHLHLPNPKIILTKRRIWRESLANENLARLLSLYCFSLVLHQYMIFSFLPSIGPCWSLERRPWRCGSAFFPPDFLQTLCASLDLSFCLVFGAPAGLLDHRRRMLMCINRLVFSVGVFSSLWRM